MAVDYAAFIASFPELASAGQTLIEAKIAEAELRVGGVAYWINESTRDLGVLYRAAHLLALSPYGMQAKLVSKEGKTTYGAHFDDLVTECGPGFFVI